MSPVQQSRIRKTKWFFEDRYGFLSELCADLGRASKRASRKGMTPAVRLNLTSDIAWEHIRFPISNMSLIEMFPAIQFYDYTKSVKRMMRFLNGEMPDNYHLTFSRSESNDHEVAKILGAGGNAAVVFGSKLPARWRGKRVVDGDQSDLRFLDPANVVVGLIAKGEAKKDTSGFVIP